MSTIVIAPDLTLEQRSIDLHGTLTYDTGSRVLVLRDADTGEEEVLSTILPSYVAAPGETFVLADSYLEGLPEALKDAGLAREVERVKVGPFAVPYARLSLVG